MTNILIVKYGALGDVIRTSYCLPGVHNKYKDCKLYWLTSSTSFDLLRYNPYIDEIITSNFNANKLNELAFDLVISLDDEKEILQRLDSIKYGEVIGAYLLNGEAVYSETAAEWFDMGLISRYGKEKADVLKRLNKREHNEILASMLDINIKEPIFYNSFLKEERAALMFDNRFFNIGINSGAGTRWKSKQLDMNETIVLIEKLLTMRIEGKETCVYLLGGKEEEHRHSILKECIPSDRLIDTGNNNSLLEFAAIVKYCNYIITSDSLALHFAISQKIRNLSYYAPTSAAEIGTFGYGTKVVSLAEDYCSYNKDADNSTITSDRILSEMSKELGF
ncbi:glycosyltransferase family 9 protein [Geobacter sp. AOG1]|uniref:glycosyltransferase family 9 protein n=1 Tax=Geobacter sp. AOG1 TaxID=1566346 RepID=UPI001CC747E4|nr:glycosyltransferase family 9 protein [Geobacter sp. AOG1]GFE58380.1 hypothetical protein AOG1_22600 [Geobacter sp. AOG1]